MIRTTRPPGGGVIHKLVVVAFDPATGVVHARHVHGALEGLDREGAEREGRRLLAELAKRRGAGASALELLYVPAHELAGGVIDRIDPATRRPVG
jgi:hypothetical protein